MIKNQLLLASLLVAASAFAAEPKLSFAEPSISPDRSEIAFVSGGDIWTVPAAGGEARLLISHPAQESRPIYSPDGKRLAFVSRRTGNGDIYILTFATGELKRLTFDDASEQLDGWSHDGKWIYYSSSSQDISGMNDIFRIPANGGTAMPVSADRYATEFFSAPSPDGATLAISARGTASGQWWRKGHSHLDEAEIWLVRGKEYQKFAGGENVPGGEKTMWPMWAADGRGIYYMSDRGGAENIWFRAIGGGPAKQITQFKDGRVLWPTISYDGKEIVFERNFEIWKVSTPSGTPVPVKITRRGQPAGPATEHTVFSNQFRDLALSPDGKKVAFVAHGDVFAASAKGDNAGGEATRVTNTPGLEQEIAWAPDSKRIVYGSDRDGVWHLYRYDFSKSAETRLTNTALSDYIPQFSPDGKKISFVRDGHELIVYDVESKQEKVLAKGILDQPPFESMDSVAWSPDSRWIAYTSETSKNFTNAWVVAAEGGEPHQVTFLANSSLGSLAWSTDGKFLIAATSQRTEPVEIVRVDLTPRDPKFREDQFRELFNTPPPAEKKPDDATKTPPKPVEIQFDGLRRRMTLLPLGLNAFSARLSPDGKMLLFVGSTAGQTNLYTYSLDELSREPATVRQLTSSAGGKSAAQFSPDSKDVFFLEQGRIQTITVENRQQKPLAVTAAVDVNFETEKMEVFREAWSAINQSFFDPKFNGVDWNAMRAKYEPHVAGSATPDETRRIISLMIGELNASHSGISPGFAGGGAAEGVGKLGLRFDRADYEGSGKLRVTEVIAMGPGAIAGVKVGDHVTAVDGAGIGAGVNLDQLLEFKVGKRVVLTVDGKEVVVRPITTAAEKNLLYRQWVDSRRAYVEKISGGKLGYIHLPDMSAQTLAQMYIDLDTDNHSRDGVVIDVRNNNGGFVNVYAIDVLARRHYLNMTPRGEATAPARSALGQRALELPTILVTNQHSLSDAEDFTEGYRALGLGKVVGEPTAGWIIYTSGIQLIDGSNLRLPFIRITTREGQPMEMHPRPVDIPVTRPIGESYTDHDSQLDAAVKELLKETAKH
jgi:Tol biopolymer transport system component/C-terminal processing protease CtpA/Prc